ncbi:Tyrosine-protein phosphatase YwqE [Thauera sp. GDN1]|uniref:tyrosine-protein phosphatase n=1 Tax=Thauera sp. GDN1 TaxID=2944810 RepID=UPI00247A5866|nr:CpsB/CapC family capsule biosynthesis tyrosine phosphatase [Thauera sp. GDN1]WEN42083.1 Tyrosine-protein phosphatase YwqE [Thauera sp. GDN1]
MYDVHCHLLPGLDDGAADLEEGLALARLAVADGITHAVCTPHIHPGRHDNTAAGIRAACDAFRAALAAQGIALRVAAAAEVRASLECLADLQAGALPFVGQLEGRPVLLLEFPHGELPYGAERITEHILAQGVLPLIAHPERNKTMIRDPRRILPFVRQGCLLQLTAGALIGRFGGACSALSQAWIDDGRVFVVASDAHNLDHRPPLLSAARAYLVQGYGVEAADRLLVDNPALLTRALFA